MLSCHQSAGQNHTTFNRSLGNVAKSRYLRTTATNQNFIQEEIKNRLNSGNACCIPVARVGRIGRADMCCRRRVESLLLEEFA
jgi:hypothetical protein